MKYIILTQNVLSAKQHIEEYEIIDIEDAKKALLESDEDVGIDPDTINDIDEVNIISAYCQLDSNIYSATSFLAITVENLTQLHRSLRDAIKELTLPELNQLSVNTACV